MNDRADRDSHTPRHTRQTRLVDVGPEGQACIARAVVSVAGRGLSAEVAARYLAGAGVKTLRVGDEAAAAAATEVDPQVQIVIDPALAFAEAKGAGKGPSPETVLANAASGPRAVAEGALLALQALREALATRQRS